MVYTNSQDTPASDTPASPIAQLLKHLGMTREDLERHSSHMRDFLTTENANFSRVLDQNLSEDTSSGTSSMQPCRSRASSFANASTPPPVPHTPTRSESVDAYAPHRVGSMDEVIERKSRLNRRGKRSRNEKRAYIPLSPSPSHSAASGDNFVQSRVFSRAIALGQPSSSYQTSQQSVPYYPHQNHGMLYEYGYGRSQHDAAALSHCVAPLPPSSPPSSPQRSSSPPMINLVSSPGPPVDNDEDPPYIIPPGPYPDEKPELSYAALIGQAVLSSKDHRLSLQHIYEWISIVYPYFKRTDQTWMNSIRHVLSTTPVFRKVLRGASKSQWAIWDKDLPCFTNGGFDRKLCADMNRRKLSKPGPSKRRAEDATGPAAKRLKQESPTLARPISSRPMFPHVLPNPHLQPYYAPYLHRSFPTNLPIQLPHISTAPPLVVQPEFSAAVTPSKFHVPPASSASSIPGLTPSLSSSSSPQLSSRDSSFQSTDAEEAPTVYVADSNEIDTPAIDALEPSITLLDQGVRDTKFDRTRTKGKDRLEKRSTTPPLFLAIHVHDAFPRPSTPPRGTTVSALHISPTLTPLSHRGLKMSPSASLLHYKTNLDPPPIATYVLGHDLELARTPSRKSSSSQYHHPITPKKLSFQFMGDSPFRSPSKGVFDPHDPGTLLEEELKRFGDEDKFSSPAGLFGRNKGLLYESPGVPSPGKWPH